MSAEGAPVVSSLLLVSSSACKSHHHHHDGTNDEAETFTQIVKSCHSFFFRNRVHSALSRFYCRRARGSRSGWVEMGAGWSTPTLEKPFGAFSLCA